MNDSELAEVVRAIYVIFEIVPMECIACKTRWTQEVSTDYIINIFIQHLLDNTSLGNTCYMNATVQAMRAIPELQAALSA